MTAPLLGAYGLSLKRGGLPVLNEVSFELQSGEFLAVLGPNGAGKSTLLQALAGVMRCEGQVRYRGEDFLRRPAAERARLVTYLGPGVHSDFPLSVEDYVLLGRLCHGGGRLGNFSAHDHEAAQLALNDCRALVLRHREITELSSGERQRVAMARALAQGSKVLLLDEALSQMDLHHQAALGRMLKRLCTEKGYAVVLVAHDLNVATEWADSALMLKGGKRVAHGPVGEVVTPERLKEVYPEAAWLVGPSPGSGKPKVFFG